MLPFHYSKNLFMRPYSENGYTPSNSSISMCVCVFPVLLPIASFNNYTQSDCISFVFVDKQTNTSSPLSIHQFLPLDCSSNCIGMSFWHPFVCLICIGSICLFLLAPFDLLNPDLSSFPIFL